MAAYPLTVAQIVSWYQSKRRSLQGSVVTLADIKERSSGPKPAARAEFDGLGTMGRINGWVSGEFDFDVIRVPDGKDILWRHVEVTTLNDELERAYTEFLLALKSS